jgi:hypothetical protein
MREFDVYSRVISFLTEANWQILCASPPGGTDNRYRKCLLPRRDLAGSERGPRDELDLTAFKDSTLLLIECKTRLSHSCQALNALGESDVQKLHRLLTGSSPEQLRLTIQRGTGQKISAAVQAAGAVVVGDVDIPTPNGISVIQTKLLGPPSLTLCPPLRASMFSGIPM